MRWNEIIVCYSIVMWIETRIICKKLATFWRFFPPPQTAFCILSVCIILLPEHKNKFWYGKGNGKAVPLQAWSGPEVSRKLRFPDYMTTAQDVGKVVSLKHRPLLPPENAPGTHFC
jgi:hypothetical protein